MATEGRRDGPCAWPTGFRQNRKSGKMPITFGKIDGRKDGNCFSDWFQSEGNILTLDPHNLAQTEIEQEILEEAIADFI